MHASRPAKVTSPVYSLSHDYVRLVPLGLIVGAAGVGLSLAMGLPSGGFRRFSFAYLTSYCFALSICLGCLFFILSQHLTRAGWSVTVRRIAEIFAMCLIPMGLLSLPIVLPTLWGSESVFHWTTSADWAGSTRIQAIKDAYLNSGFFGIRVVLYFVIWGAMAWYFFGRSLTQDRTGDKMISRGMQRNSTWMMIIFAATLVFAAFDFEMSLAPLWFSTMFPVYFFAGAVMSAMATITLTALLLQNSGRITDEITVEHYHDLAKLMFAFVFFWGYISFSQFMLIWYANLPEETVWFKHRMYDEYGWGRLSLILLFGHLLIPFLGLMARTVRRSKPYLFFAAIYLLVMHWVDHFWIVMPEYSQADHSFTFSWLIDVPCAIGMAGFLVAFFALIAGNRSLVPLKDPRLGECLNFKNGA